VYIRYRHLLPFLHKDSPCYFKVYGHSSPEFLKPLLDKENVRLNFTFRDAPNALGREKDFKYDVDSTYKEVLDHLLTNKEN